MRMTRSLIALALPVLALACGGSPSSTSSSSDPVAGTTDPLLWGHPHDRVVQRLKQTNLVSNQAGVAQTTDPNLVNAWGLSFNTANGLAWVSDNGAGLATVYDSNADLKLTVTIPPPAGGTPPSTPTGQLFNTDSTTFMGDRFIFVTEDGTVVGWQPSDGTTAVLRATATDGAVYKGVAKATVKGKPRLYVADLHNAKIDVYDDGYQLVPLPGFLFRDFFLPPNFAPFNVFALSEHLLLVSYAKQALPDKHDDQAGPGNGFVDLFDADGHMLARLISRGALNSPWGMAITPQKFGHISRQLLVGNFGDGAIHVYDLDLWHHPDARFVGSIGDEQRNPLSIDGLWSLVFPPDVDGVNSQQLYFTAGPDDEANGLFGRLELP